MNQTVCVCDTVSANTDLTLGPTAPSDYPVVVHSDLCLRQLATATLQIAHATKIPKLPAGTERNHRVPLPTLV
eukprot:4894550-Amphidinium_carterae.1